MKSQAHPIRVRIPPSPTGTPHVGNAYMAIFNQIFARKHHGKLVIRFEDTDLERNDPTAEEQIMDALRWLGVKWNEGPDVGGEYGPYRQSERLKIYQEAARKLVDEKMAYLHEGAIFLEVDDTGSVEFTDAIRDKITTPKSVIKDQVLIKSNGYPTYNFAVAVDDIQMRISHIIRGEDHISNTPKQVLIYQALGANSPAFAHLPLIRTPGGAKLSKRHGTLSLLEYREQGYLPEAIVNYLILLGWSHPEEKEVFGLEDVIELFELEDVHTTAPAFDPEKLRWLNGQWINKLGIENLELRIKNFYAEEDWDKETFKKVVPLVQERMRTLAEFKELASYFFVEEINVEPELLAEYIKDSQTRKQFLLSTLRNLSNLKSKDWQAAILETTLRAVQEEHNLSSKEAFMTLRVALTGQTATPGLFETIEALGQPKTLRRLHQVAN